MKPEPAVDLNHEPRVSAEATSETEPLPNEPTQSKTIVLQVGERRFSTYASTLTTESPYFAHLLSPQWQDGIQADGSYFIDADSDLFAHVLRYLRTGVLPIFYSSVAGHDYGKYHSLLGEAEYFAIERLVTWLKDKEYEKMVKMEHSVREVEGSEILTTKCQSNVHLEYQNLARITKQVYLCPRRIFVHRGDPSRCGRQCHNAKRESGDEFEDEEVIRALVVSRRTILYTRPDDPEDRALAL